MTSYTTIRKIGGKKFERVGAGRTKSEAQKFADLLRKSHPKWSIRVIEDDRRKFSLNNHWGVYAHMPPNSGTMYGGDPSKNYIYKPFEVGSAAMFKKSRR